MNGLQRLFQQLDSGERAALMVIGAANDIIQQLNIKQARATIWEKGTLTIVAESAGSRTLAQSQKTALSEGLKQLLGTRYQYQPKKLEIRFTIGQVGR